MGPTSTFFSKKNFKIGSHSTIHTFKKKFATVFSVFSNKRYPNRPLVSSDFPYAMGYKEFNLQVVGQHCRFQLIERWSSKDDVVCRWAIYHEEVNLLGDLCWISAYNYG